MNPAFFLFTSQLTGHAAIWYIPNHITLAFLNRSVLNLVHSKELRSYRVRFALILLMIRHWLHNMELFLRSFDFINFIICKLRRFHKREPRARASTTTFDLWTPDPTFKKCCCCGLLPLWWRCLDTLARVHSQLVKPVRNQT